MRIPLIARNLLESIGILASASMLFAERCVDGLEANEAANTAHAEATLATATALNPHIGYDRATEIVKEAAASGRVLREVAREMGVDERDARGGARPRGDGARRLRARRPCPLTAGGRVPRRLPARRSRDRRVGARHHLRRGERRAHAARPDDGAARGSRARPGRRDARTAAVPQLDPALRPDPLRLRRPDARAHRARARLPRALADAEPAAVGARAHARARRGVGVQDHATACSSSRGCRCPGALLRPVLLAVFRHRHRRLRRRFGGAALPVGP